ncbi:hypothetical protein FACS1894190_08320 [Spirochaetia bacterium]|nr:hypothetical protein FACS1894190_08320 [Spirochaetia bacterium]
MNQFNTFDSELDCNLSQKKYPVRRYSQVCRNPFVKVGVSHKGDVSIGCDRGHYLHIGNLFENDFASIWNSDAAKNLRKKIWECDYSDCRFHTHFPTFVDKSKIEGYYQADGTVTKFPSIVKFDDDYSCNVACVTCRNKIRMMNKEDSERLDSYIDDYYLPILKDAKTVYMNGVGEYFASRHCLNLTQRIIEKYPQIKFHIHTNGILCDEENCKRIGIIDKLYNVSVSFHASTKETYDKIVKGGNFERVMKNLKWLSDQKKQGKIFLVEIIMAVSSINYKEMKAFMQLAKNLDIRARFWELGTGFSVDAPTDQDYEKYAVCLPGHPEYKKMVKLLQAPIFKSDNCLLDPLLESIRKGKAYNINNKLTLRRLIKYLLPYGLVRFIQNKKDAI